MKDSNRPVTGAINPGSGNVAPIPSASDRHYSAPRSPVAQDKGWVPGVVSVNYSPNIPTPGGAVNGPSPKQ